jgi:PmbA protein
LRFEPKGARLLPSFFNRAIHSTRAGFKANQLRAVEFEEIETRAARALTRGRLGHASSTDPEANERQLIARAVAASLHGKPIGMTFPSARAHSRPADNKLVRLTPQDIAQIGEQVVAVIRQAAPDASVELQAQRTCEHFRLHNSAGGRAEMVTGILGMDVWVERHRADDVLVVFDSFKTARLDASHHDLAARIAQRLIWADKLVEIEPGRMPVILSPTAAATLLQPLVLALSGARVRGKSSPLVGRLGQPMFDSQLTIVDDGTLADRPGGAFDHEGIPTQRTTLIQGGVVEGFYYDLKTAAQAGVPSTGNGRRDLLAPPRPQPGNIVVLPGTTSLEAMLQQAGDGLLVDLLLGANPATALRGTFSRTVLLGYKIERGRIAGYVKGVALAGNLYEMLRDIKAIGDTGYWSGDIYSPYLLVDGLSISI